MGLFGFMGRRGESVSGVSRVDIESKSSVWSKGFAVVRVSM